MRQISTWLLFALILSTLSMACATGAFSRIVKSTDDELIEMLPEMTQEFITNNNMPLRRCSFTDGELLVAKRYVSSGDPEVDSGQSHVRSRDGYFDEMKDDFNTFGFIKEVSVEDASGSYRSDNYGVVAYFPHNAGAVGSFAEMNPFPEYRDCDVFSSLDRGTTAKGTGYFGLMVNDYASSISRLLITILTGDLNTYDIKVEDFGNRGFRVQLLSSEEFHFMPTKEFDELQDRMVQIMLISSKAYRFADGDEVVFVPPSLPWRMYRLLHTYAVNEVMQRKETDIYPRWKALHNQDLMEAGQLFSLMAANSMELILEAAKSVDPIRPIRSIN